MVGIYKKKTKREIQINGTIFSALKVIEKYHFISNTIVLSFNYLTYTCHIQFDLCAMKLVWSLKLSKTGSL